MARRDEVLTATRYPLVLNAYQALGVMFLALLETRWKKSSPIYGFFIPSITGVGVPERTWRRWKSPRPVRGATLHGDYPENIFKSLDWAHSQQLIDRDETDQFRRFFTLLLQWKTTEHGVLSDGVTSLSYEIEYLMSFALEVAQLEVGPDLEYIDKLTRESYSFKIVSVNGKDKWKLTPSASDSKIHRGLRSDEQSFLRDSALRVLIVCNDLLDQSAEQNELYELGLQTPDVRSLTYHQRQALRTHFLAEAEELLERIFSNFRDIPNNNLASRNGKTRKRKNDRRQEGTLLAQEIGKMVKQKLRESQREQEALRRK